MTLDGIMFENLFLSLFVDRIVREFASIQSRIFDVVIISVLVKADIFEVIGCGRTKNWMVLYESHQDWF